MSEFVVSATADTFTSSSEKDKHVIKSASRFEESQVQVKKLTRSPCLWSQVAPLLLRPPPLLSSRMKHIPYIPQAASLMLRMVVFTYMENRCTPEMRTRT